MSLKLEERQRARGRLAEWTEGKLLTPKEVAEILGVTYDYVLIQLRKRNLIGFKFGSQYRLSIQQIKDFLDKHRTGIDDV